MSRPQQHSKPASALRSAVAQPPQPSGSPMISLMKNRAQMKVCQVIKIGLFKRDISFWNQEKSGPLLKMGGGGGGGGGTDSDLKKTSPPGVEPFVLSGRVRMISDLLLHLHTLSIPSSPPQPTPPPPFLCLRGGGGVWLSQSKNRDTHTECTSTSMHVTHVHTFFSNSQRQSTANLLPFMD